MSEASNEVLISGNFYLVIENKTLNVISFSRKVLQKWILCLPQLLWSIYLRLTCRQAWHGRGNSIYSLDSATLESVKDAIYVRTFSSRIQGYWPYTLLESSKRTPFQFSNEFAELGLFLGKAWKLFCTCVQRGYKGGTKPRKLDVLPIQWFMNRYRYFLILINF